MKTDKHTITLTYDPTKAGGPWFTSDDPTKFPKPGSQTAKIKVAKGDDAEITFSIKTKDINFAKERPIEISLSSGQNGPDNSQQFTWTPGGTDTLTVTDPNTDQYLTEYYYKLNFDGKPSLDPIIQNGCCQRADSGGGFLSFFTEPAGIAVLLLAVAVIALVALRMRRAG